MFEEIRIIFNGLLGGTTFKGPVDYEIVGDFFVVHCPEGDNGFLANSIKEFKCYK